MAASITITGPLWFHPSCTILLPLYRGLPRCNFELLRFRSSSLVVPSSTVVPSSLDPPGLGHCPGSTLVCDLTSSAFRRSNVSGAHLCATLPLAPSGASLYLARTYGAHQIPAPPPPLSFSAQSCGAPHYFPARPSGRGCSARDYCRGEELSCAFRRLSLPGSPLRSSPAPL